MYVCVCLCVRVCVCKAGRDKSWMWSNVGCEIAQKQVRKRSGNMKSEVERVRYGVGVAVWAERRELDWEEVEVVRTRGMGATFSGLKVKTLRCNGRK